MKKKTRIIIVEKNRLHRESLHLALSQIADFTVLPDADTADDIVRAAAEHRIDLVLLSHDIGNGSADLTQLRRQFPALNILVLLDYADACFCDAAMNEGATDAIPRSSGKREIEQHIRTIMEHLKENAIVNQ